MTTRHDGYESEPLFEAHPAQETVSNTPSAIQFTVEGTPPFAPANVSCRWEKNSALM